MRFILNLNHPSHPKQYGWLADDGDQNIILE